MATLRATLNTYATRVLTATNDYLSALNRLRSLDAALQRRPQVASDVVWRTHTVMALTSLRDAARALDDARPAPASLSTVAIALEEVRRATDAFARTYTTSRNPSLLTLNRVVEALQRAITTLR